MYRPLPKTANDSGITGPPALSTGPTAIPGYDIVGELGRGGMGVVYKAWQVAAKRFVALKMVVPDAKSDEAALRRFQAEAQAVAQLSHPNIIQIYAVSDYHGWPFFCLEFCGGGSLAKKLGGSPMLPSPAAQLVEKLARAVATAHEKHIVHRDLKPANILLTTEGEPKITDFGLAKKLDSVVAGNTRTGAVVGTPSYMSPEQAMGSLKEVGPAAWTFYMHWARFSGQSRWRIPRRAILARVALPREEHVSPAGRPTRARRPSTRSTRSAVRKSFHRGCSKGRSRSIWRRFA